MILNLEQFLSDERAYWQELETALHRLTARSGYRPDLREVRRFHYLYRRAASDLARLKTFASEPETTRYLEGLVAQAYAEIHETREAPYRFHPLRWFFRSFPRTVRFHWRALAMATAAMLAGACLGGVALAVDREFAKEVIMPFPHLLGDPSERVERDEYQEEDRLAGYRSTFAAQLMTNNIRVSIGALALGLTFGFGTLVMLFFNGVILGAVALDYILAGETVFLMGWLLPHGAIEIPAILLAGQAGLVLGQALLGWGSAEALRERLRQVAPRLLTLIGGVAALLVWAGIVEAFFSQYHEPTLPYGLKISFGVVELVALVLFLCWAGRRRGETERAP